MKKNLLGLLLTILPPCLWAQPLASKWNDSSRMVILAEVKVKTVKKSTQQQLIHYYKANAAATLEEIMSRLPELSLVRRGAYGMEPTIRSFNGGQINVLLDGMRIHGACTDKMDPATIYIEPVNLEKLQVQTTESGMTDGSATGGTINMKIAEPDYVENNKIKGSVSSGYQSAANSILETMRLNYANGRWAFLSTGTYRKNQDYRSGGGVIIPHSQFEKVNYSLAAAYKINEHTSLNTTLLADDGWNIGYPALPMDVGYAAARIAALTLQNNNPDKALYKWRIKVYANRVKHFMDDSQRPEVPMHMDMPGISKTSGLLAEGSYRLNQQQQLLVKADVASTFLKASMTMYQSGQAPMYMLTWPDNRKNQAGIGVSWIKQWNKNLDWQINSRLDFITARLVTKAAKDQLSVLGYNTTSRNELLKNVASGFTQKINRNWLVKSSVSYSERMPTATELYGFYLFNSSDGYDYIGDPGLKPEQSVQADASLVFNRSQLRFQLNLYYARTTNYIIGVQVPGISTMTIGANGVKKFINNHYASLWGSEANFIVKSNAYWNWISTVRYTLGYDNNRDPLPFIAPLKNINSLRYQRNHLMLQVETEAALPQNRINKNTGEDTTPSYCLLHFRMGFNTNIGNTTIAWQGGVENLLDKKYHEHLDWGNISRPGRNIYLQMTVQF